MIFSKLFGVRAKVPTVDQHLGGRLRTLRESRGIGGASVAEILRISTRELSRIERGRHRLSASQLFVLARHFEVPVAAFFDRREGLS